MILTKINPGGWAVSHLYIPFFLTRLLLCRSNDWMTSVVGIMTKSLNLESNNDDVRKAAVNQLTWELGYSTHLGKAKLLLFIVMAFH